jgi:hypothetical protein
MNPTKPILLAFVLSAALGACTDGDTIGGNGPDVVPEPDGVTEPDDTSGGEDNTFEHPGGPDIWDYLERLAEEGPPAFSSRMHSCPKMTYARIGNLLASRGVDLNGQSNLSAGFLWRNGAPALGAPKLDVRSRESTEITTAAAAKLFDIFAQAAPEIIAAMPTLEACMVDGVGTEMFNAEGQCTANGITCLTGTPASPTHLELCNEMVTRASTTQKGQEIAVAALAAAAHTCE